jgi:hypothetical protein
LAQGLPVMSTNVARINRTSWARAMSAREILSVRGEADTAGVATLVIETFLSGRC